MRNFTTVLAAAALVKLTACSGAGGVATRTETAEPSVPAATPRPTIDRSKTVTVDGQHYTCGQMIDAENKVCGDGFQVAFNSWGDGLHAYTVGGSLGPLGNTLKNADNPNAKMRYEDVAASGLAACIVGTRGTGIGDPTRQNEFIHWLQQSYPDEPRAAFLPFWFQASRALCPDAFASTSTRAPHPPIVP